MIFSFDKLIKNASKSWSFFLDLIFPNECFGCGCEGVLLCQKCFSFIKLRPEQSCLDCKQKTDFGKFCPRCAPNYDLDGVLIASYYDQKIVDKLIKSFKYYFVKDSHKDLGKILILFLNDLLNKEWQAFNIKKSLIMPVPLSAYRKRWRGFNQSEILARLVADNFNLKLSVNELIRIKHTKPQVKLDKTRRKNNIKDCFDLDACNLAGRQIILIDDVVTTGATLNECAKILKQHGSGKVWGLALANG
ncbi:MAG: ComF family protein [bacterium]